MESFIFSAEEINLMCIFGISDKESLMNELRESLTDVYDPDMQEIFHSTLEKLACTSPEDVSRIGWFAAEEIAGEV